MCIRDRGREELLSRRLLALAPRALVPLGAANVAWSLAVMGVTDPRLLQWAADAVCQKVLPPPPLPSPRGHKSASGRCKGMRAQVLLLLLLQRRGEVAGARRGRVALLASLLPPHS
eukprot:2580598-Rhodomonas_salina.1